MHFKDPIAVRRLFNSTSSKYDLLNDLLSFGLHRVWKKQTLKWLNPRPGEYWLDLCCGTGDMAISLAKLLGPEGKVLGIDNAENTLNIARKRTVSRKNMSILWLEGDVINTKLVPKSFDGAVMAYGLRNLYDPKAGLYEIYRLLKPGSKVGILDFNRMVKGSIGESFQKFYLRKVVVPVASLFGLSDHYAYIEKSLRTFPEGKEQESLALEVGFAQATYKKLAWGQMGVLLLKA